MNYFQGLNTVGEIKKHYRKLAFQNHPDHGGDTEIMKVINNQYHEALKYVDGSKSVGTDDKEHVYNYNYDIEQEIIDKLNELLSLKMIGIEIELIGVWIWLQGETKQYKEQLKALKCRWHSKRKCWYFAKTTYRRRYSGASFDELRVMYGTYSANNKSEDKNRLAA